MSIKFFFWNKILGILSESELFERWSLKYKKHFLEQQILFFFGFCFEHLIKTFILGEAFIKFFLANLGPSFLFFSASNKGLESQIKEKACRNLQLKFFCVCSQSLIFGLWANFLFCLL